MASCDAAINNERSDETVKGEEKTMEANGWKLLVGESINGEKWNESCNLKNLFWFLLFKRRICHSEV